MDACVCSRKVCAGRGGLAPSPNSRSLDFFEAYAAAAHDLIGAFVVTTVATVEPAVGVEEVQAAAAELQRCHPMLRSRLVVDPTGTYISLSVDGGGPVEVKEYACDVMEAARLELSTRLPSPVCIWRLAVCGPHVLLSYHHAVLDGKSVMTIYQDLLDVLGGGRLDESGALGGVTPVARDTLPYYFWPIPEDALPVHTWPEATSLAPWRERQTRQVWHQLSADATSSLVQRCRAEGTTMQGVLGAAAVEAMTSVMEGFPPLCLQTIVDIRPFCKRGPKVVGNFIGVVRSVLSADRSFWELARQYRSDIIRGMGEQTHLGFALHWPVPSHRWIKWYLEQELAKDNGDMTKCACSISNRGSYRLVAASHRVTAMHWARQHGGDCTAADFAMVNACSVGGSLCLTLCYIWPRCSEELGTVVLERLVECLLGGGPPERAWGSAGHGKRNWPQ